MKESGIDTVIFRAHSTKGASTSKAKTVGVSVADILKAANWSSSSTFTRPVQSHMFRLGVLRLQQPPSQG